MQAGASSAVSIAVKSGFGNFSNDFMLFSSRWSESSRGDHRSPAAAPTRSTFTSEHLTLSVGLTSAFNKVLLAQNLSNRDASFHCGLMYGGSVGSRDNIDYGLNGKSSMSKTLQIVHRRSTERFLNVSCGRLEFHSKTCPFQLFNAFKLSLNYSEKVKALKRLLENILQARQFV